MKYVFSIIIMSFMFAHSLHALEAPTNLKSTYVDDVSVVLNWGEVSDSIGYYLYYGTQSGNGESYEFEGVDLIGETNTRVEGLTSDTEYFFAVTSVDDNGEESSFSEEVALITLVPGEKPDITTPLQITSVESNYSDTVILEFSKNIDNAEDASREFILIDSDFGEEVLVIGTQLDQTRQNTLTLSLSENLIPNTSYELTILNILGADGSTIEDGIDGFTSFRTPSSFTSQDQQEVVETEGDQEESSEIEFTAAGIDEENSEVEVKITENEVTVTTDNTEVSVSSENNEIIQGKSGTTLPQEEINTGTVTVADNTQELPQTGAQHILLLLIAGLLGVGFYARNKRV